ncbi:MAG: hypothetical protein AAGM04_12090 [Pseudomonadota bacterium]
MATQCSGSTRGMMSELRRTFKDVPHAISVNRTDVTLHEAFWRTDADSEDLKDPSDFLENIELRDPCYVEWRHNQAKALIQKRTQANTTESAAQHLALMQLPGSGAINEGLSIGMRVEGGSSIATELVSTMLASQIGRNMGDQVTARLYDHTGEAQPNDNHDIGITCHIAEGAQRSTAFLKIIQNADRRVLFVRNIELPTDAAAAFQNNSLSKTAFLAAEEVLSKLVTQSHLQRPELTAAHLAQVARERIFSFKPEQLSSADCLLAQAYEIDANPVLLAWRAFIRNAQFIEILEGDREQFRIEATQFVEQAMRAGGNNAQVLSLCAFVTAVMFDECETAMELAFPALESNPNSAFALQSIASVQLRNGNLKEAYDYSKRSHSIACYSAIGHWWDLSHSLVCVATGRLNEAHKLAQTASRKSPHFRPPLRALLALEAANGDLKAGQITHKRLANLEGGFSLDRFLDDPAYPVRTLRNAGLLEFNKTTKDAIRIGA